MSDKIPHMTLFTSEWWRCLDPDDRIKIRRHVAAERELVEPHTHKPSECPCATCTAIRKSWAKLTPRVSSLDVAFNRIEALEKELEERTSSGCVSHVLGTCTCPECVQAKPHGSGSPYTPSKRLDIHLDLLHEHERRLADIQKQIATIRTALHQGGQA